MAYFLIRSLYENIIILLYICQTFSINGSRGPDLKKIEEFTIYPTSRKKRDKKH